MPIGDWQFWVVTLAAGVCVWLAARAMVPRKKPRKTGLTIGGKPVKRRR